jgi:enoyl-CoA hydratase
VTEAVLMRERRGATLVLTCNRPEKLNALSTEMLEAFDDALDDAEGDDAVRAIVLTGAGGRAFVAGADIEEYSRLDHDGFVAYQARSRRLFSRIDRFGTPIVGAVHGYALGGGFELALCCDVLIATRDARFGLPEGSLGLCPGGGGTQRLTRAVGPFVASDLLMSARRLRADEALSLGLVSEVVEPDALMDAAQAKADAIVASAPLAVREMKALVRAASGEGLEAGLDLEQAALARLRSTADAEEGIRAFVEKRPPRFRGA